MTDAADLLDAESQAFERVLARAMTDELPVPIADIMNPATTPVEFLPFLAANESVDLWFDDWSEARKRQMVAEALDLASLKGTHIGVVGYLGYVDAEVIDTVAYPARFVFGRSSPTFTPINHPPFKARYLVKVTLKKPFNALALGRSALGRAAVRTVDLEPIRRAKLAMTIAKAPEAEYLVSFAWRRGATFGEAIPFGDAPPFGAFIDRATL